MLARAISLVAVLAAGPALAEEPLSAIDWLSDSVATPVAPAPPPGDIARTALPGPISVSPLGAPRADAVGLLPPSATGFPRNLWGAATTDEIVARLEAVPVDPLPSLRRLFTTLLLAEANPPVDSGPEDRLLMARVDRLLLMGALDQAAALLDRAGPETPERFRRYFDIALLQGAETQACARMRARPEISPTYPARIFCLARGGDWAAAAVTLETAEALGILTPEEDALLARFLDADIVDNFEELGAAWRVPSPLVFRMLEAIGEPQATTQLPLAYAWADMRATRGWKAQLEAAERLARHGAVPANRMAGLYLRQRPSASGGIWERAKSVQALQSALSDGDAAAVAEILPDAWRLMREAGLAEPFAEQYGAELSQMELDEDTSALAFRVGLLSSAYEEIAQTAMPQTAQDSFLAALARGMPQSVAPPDALSRAVQQGFGMPKPPPALQLLLNQGRTGEAVLRAIVLFSEGAAGDHDGISGAIALMRAVGLESTARRAALEMLVAEAAG